MMSSSSLWTPAWMTVACEFGLDSVELLDSVASSRMTEMPQSGMYRACDMSLHNQYILCKHCRLIQKSALHATNNQTSPWDHPNNI